MIIAFLGTFAAGMLTGIYLVYCTCLEPAEQTEQIEELPDNVYQFPPRRVS